MNKIKVKSLGLLLLATLVSCGDGGSHSSSSSNLPQEGSTLNPSTAMDAPEINISIRKKVDFAPDFSNFETFKENINSYIWVFTKPPIKKFYLRINAAARFARLKVIVS